MEKNKEKISKKEDCPKPENEKTWLIIGWVSTVLSILQFVPPLVEVFISPSNNSNPIYDVSLYVIAAVSNILWTTYGFGINSLPVAISSVVTVAITIVFIILVYTYKP